jgi:biopolymer transport protein ExbD
VVVNIDVDFDGTVLWDGQVVNKDTMQYRFQEMGHKDPEDQPEIHLHPNKLVAYKYVAMVMASAQRLGVTKIGLVGNEQL